MPLHLTEGVGHWVLFAIHPQEGVIQCLDPMGAPYLDMLYLLAEVMGETARWWGQEARLWLLEPTNMRVQQPGDTTNCGAYVCAFAQAISRDTSIIIGDVDEYRMMLFQVYDSTLYLIK